MLKTPFKGNESIKSANMNNFSVIVTLIPSLLILSKTKFWALTSFKIKFWLRIILIHLSKLVFKLYFHTISYKVFKYSTKEIRRYWHLITSIEGELPGKDTEDKSRLLSLIVVLFRRDAFAHSFDISFCVSAEQAFCCFFGSFMVLLLEWIFSS